MAIYGILTRDQRTLLWLGPAAGPEAACEEARLQDRNPPGPNNILVVLATPPEGEWTHIVYAVRQCAVAGYYFVDFL